VPGWIVGLFVAAMVVSVFASAYFGFEVGRSNPKLIYQTVTSRDFTIVTVPSLVLQTVTVTAPAIVVTTTTTVTATSSTSVMYRLEVRVRYNGSGPVYVRIIDIASYQLWQEQAWNYYGSPDFVISLVLPASRTYEIQIVTPTWTLNRLVFLYYPYQTEVFFP
jgi:hypothetical protein